MEGNVARLWKMQLERKCIQQVGTTTRGECWEKGKEGKHQAHETMDNYIRSYFLCGQEDLVIGVGDVDGRYYVKDSPTSSVSRIRKMVQRPDVSGESQMHGRVVQRP